ncbi:MAG TPA: DUF2225 domain-containing protein, partial [Armatimonadetes bacterium]|nr:DUF2225 domain-containing protein [Armatimonadota bacterium]
MLHRMHSSAVGQMKSLEVIAMTTLIHRALICPQCRRPFWTPEISSCSYGGKDTDFRPQFWGMNPLPFFVHRCPRCSFIGHATRFESCEEMPDEDMDALPFDPLDSGIQRYNDVALQMIKEGANKQEIGDAFLKAAWCARIDEDNDAEREALRNAATWFAQALDEGLVEKGMEAVIAYLVGELNRRIGEFDLAIEFFERARQLPMHDE